MTLAAYGAARAAIRKLEAICGRDVGRGIGPLVDAARGGLAAAAQSIAGHGAPHVALMTGFFVPGAEPPAAETDGPLGVATLAAGLCRVGVPVRVVTDELCVDAVRVACRAAGAVGDPLEEITVDVLPLQGRGEVVGILDTWRSASPPVSHAVAVERVGPAADGVPRNMRGQDISAYTAPLHLLFQAGGHQSIGIGDGGNELGMGSLPRWLVAQAIEDGDKIGCTVAADHLLVCGVSNWGAWALLAALAVLRPDWRASLLATLQPDLARRALEVTVAEGPAVDGVLGRQQPSVDGLAASVQTAVLEKIVAIAEGCPAGEESS